MLSGNFNAAWNLKTICNELADVKYKWSRIGVNLGIPFCKLEEFKEHRDPFLCIINYMLTNVDTFSWKSIVDALKSRDVDEPLLAKSIAEKYKVIKSTTDNG